MKNLSNFLTGLFLTIKPEERIVMSRLGTIETNLVSANQCKDVGWTHYEYLVKITCYNRLDESGFLIDNKLINHTMKECIREMMSCELLCKHFADELEKLFKHHKVPVCEMYVSVKPFLPATTVKDYAEFEFVRVYKPTKL